MGHEHDHDGDQADCTDCADCADDHFGSTSAGTSSKAWDGSPARFTDEQYKMASAACDSDGPPKTACFLPHHEPSGAVNVNGVHAAAQRVSSLKGHDAAAVKTAKAHLRAHYAKLKEDPPDSISASRYRDVMLDLAAAVADWDDDGGGGGADMGSHGSFSGKHAHEHSPMGSQGGDETHDHAHDHDGDSVHDHHSTQASGRRTVGWNQALGAAGRGSFRTDPDVPGRWEQTLAGLQFMASGEIDPDPMLGAAWGVKQTESGWHVLTAGAVPWGEGPVESYAEALEVIGGQLATDRPGNLAETWQSDMAYENVSTGDGRFIEPGGIQYRNTPLPLMLQTETENGHMGAVLAGAITATGKTGYTATGRGTFDDSPAGRQFLQILNARGRFGVSIDVAEAEGQPVCSVHGEPSMDTCLDCDDIEFHFSMVRVMGVTGTPFPAFEDAYIELASQADGPDGAVAPVAASSWGFDNGGILPAGVTTYVSTWPVVPVVSVVPAGQAVPGGGGIVAAGSSRRRETYAPAAWFEDPQFRPGDGRMAKQPHGAWACPLTVLPPDPATGLRRVYAHLGSWSSCHTGYRDKCVTPPRSASGCAAFNLRPVMTAEGRPVPVGHLTMGVGHLTRNAPTAEVTAHYDGGPGAVTMAYVRAGEDEHGTWLAGYVLPSRTADQIEAFSACSISGDWREVWSGKGLDLVAVLAGVKVPGFPIVQALAASGWAPPEGAQAIGEPWMAFDGDRVVALVASGVVSQPMPWEPMLAALTNDLAAALSRVVRLEGQLSIMRPVIRDQLAAQFATPTPADKGIMAGLQAVKAGVADLIDKQKADPDADTDPDDHAVMADLEMIDTAVDKAISDQAKDGAPDPKPTAKTGS